MSAPRLLDQVRTVARLRHLSLSTEKCYVQWIKRFILFHNKRHPSEMREAEIRQFLSNLAVEERVASSTQNVAFCSLIFLYKDVLKLELPYISGVERARAPRRLPVVFSRFEVRHLLAHMSDTHHLIASILYGSGLRVMEAVKLRVKDIDFESGQINVKEGKGANDRVTILPKAIQGSLKEHLARVRVLHENDLRAGFGRVLLPYALERKYPRAGRE